MARAQPPKAGFKRGHRKYGGRAKGTPNKVTVEAKRAAAEIVDDPVYRRRLAAAARARKLSPVMESLLWYYAKGKPKDEVDLDVKMRPSEMSDEQMRERALALADRLKGR
jgi:hypothetical protein